MQKFIFLFFMIPAFLLAKEGYFKPWGKDANLKVQKIREPDKKVSILTQIADKVIVFHQKVLSPVDGPRSHFRPTSSRYMQLAMQRYGFFRGYIMGCDRLLRENSDPWVYRKITIDKTEYKFDPASHKKYVTMK